jgi:hypothetical protein
MKISLVKWALLAAAVTLFVGPAMADSLTVGGSAVPTSLAALPSGLTLLADVSSPYTLMGAGGTATGTTTAWVYMTSGGTLDFAYQVTNNASSTDLIDTLSMASFGGFATDVDYLNAAGDNAPSLATRPGGTGNVVNFDFFPNDIVAGDTSDVLLIETNATNFNPGTLSLIDSGVAKVAAFEPTGTPSMPEPSSLLMIGSGLAGLMAFRRRQNAL